MTSRDFCFWLQGKLEGREITDLTDSELNLIPAHLSLAFVHDIDPSMGDEEQQAKLNAIHNRPEPHGNAPDETLMRC